MQFTYQHNVTEPVSKVTFENFGKTLEKLVLILGKY